MVTLVLLFRVPRLPGDIMSALSILVESCSCSRRSRYSLREPNLVLAYILYFRVRDLMNSCLHTC